MVNTSIFVPGNVSPNLLIARVNKVCTLEDAYIIAPSAMGFPDCKTRVLSKNRIQIYGRICEFQKISIMEIIETLDEPDELQPEGLKFYYRNVKSCTMYNQKVIDAYIIGSKKPDFAQTSTLND
jgi:hypothetical protein